MIARYTGAEMGRIWSDQRRFETWLQVEIAAAEAMAEAGIIPADAARDIREARVRSLDRELASEGPGSRVRTRALPTITPSARRDTCLAWSGAEIPNPTRMGNRVTRRSRAIPCPRSGGRAWRIPVVPVTET